MAENYESELFSKTGEIGLLKTCDAKKASTVREILKEMKLDSN